MPLDRIPGDENLFIGSAIVAAQQKMLDAHHVTHIVSTLQYTAAEQAAIAHAEAQRVAEAPEPRPTPRQRLFVDVDDVEEEDLLVHLPKIVRFIGHAFDQDPANGVLVHCAMGKSRSAAAVVAYLLWRRPAQFGSGREKKESDEAVQHALDVVREARAVAEPNAGFMHQLALWWRMGCPADTDDAVEASPAYQHWLYRKDVEESARIGRAPERLWFGDEDGVQHKAVKKQVSKKIQLKCKKCRRMLADSTYIIPHAPEGAAPAEDGASGCQHHFVEPLSWMRPVLEQGALEGRIVCPNSKCGALVGRYSWQGFKCTCRAWVCPAFSLQESRVDRSVVADAGDRGNSNPHNIRLPPGMSKV